MDWKGVSEMARMDANKAIPLRQKAWEKKCEGACWKPEKRTQEN